MNIFCLPYSGGSSLIYSKLRMKLKDCANIIPIEYPGHGFRLSEEFSDSIQSLADDVYEQILKKDDGSEFAILGYSMGSTVAYELFIKYRNSELFKRLKFIIFCAMSPGKGDYIDVSDIDDAQFMEYVISLGGSRIDTEEEMKNYKSLLPVIRQDFKIFLEYKKIFSADSNIKVDKTVYVLYSDDETNIHDYDDICSGRLRYKKMDGGHFFINSNLDDLTNELRLIITQCALGLV